MESSTEALSTRCGGQGVVVFYGMAKPVRVPNSRMSATTVGERGVALLNKSRYVGYGYSGPNEAIDFESALTSTLDISLRRTN